MSKSEEIANSIVNDVKLLENKARLYDEMVKIYGTIESFRQLAQRYYAIEMSVSEVAKFHSVDVRTIRSYIDLGLIPLHPKSTDGKKIIRGSDALMIDFPTLRHQASQKNKDSIIDFNMYNQLFSAI